MRPPRVGRRPDAARLGPRARSGLLVALVGVVSVVWVAPAIAGGPPVAYVTNETSDTVTPIDTATNVA